MPLIKNRTDPLPNLPTRHFITHLHNLPRHIAPQHQILLQCCGVSTTHHSVVPKVEGDGMDADEYFVR